MPAIRRFSGRIFTSKVITEDSSTRGEYFPGAVFGESILERDFGSIPPATQALSGFGAIPFEIEHLLLLFRLFRPGDLVFVALHLEKPDVKATQCPYHAISNLAGVSTRQFVFNQVDIAPWEDFAHLLRAAPAWHSKWFEVSSHYLLCGVGKQFNPNFESEVDSIVDYVAALEAARVPERDFVGRRLRYRIAGLLGLSGSQEHGTRKLVSDAYAIRSTLIHGSPLSQYQLSFLRNRDLWLEFEQLSVSRWWPFSGACQLRSPPWWAYLADLYDVDVTQRAPKESARTLRR